MPVGVRIDASKAVDMLTRLEAALHDKSTMRYGAELIRKDQARAFAGQQSPDGVAWAPRTRSYPWPLMWKSGGLMRSVTAGWGIKTKRGGPKLFAKLTTNDAKTAIAAGALHFGRGNSQSRHTAGRARRRAASFVQGKMSGFSAMERPMVARPFFGLSRSSEQKFTDHVKRKIHEAVR
jgi:phage gpG-like protein